MNGEVLATGRFRVDRRRALEKMKKFQLADPLAYTLELVAAAVACGATAIHVENDSDDFVLSWQGPGPDRDELDALFDHLFGNPKTPRETMLQHLAIGVIGALGQRPSQVHVDGPGFRLAVVDVATAMAHEHPEAKQPRIHVRQRWSFGNVGEAVLLPVRSPGETRLLQRRARWCPVPLSLNGTLLPAAGDGLTLVEGPGVVDVVRFGITVAHFVQGSSTVEGARPAELHLAGVVRADHLELDASRGQVVHGKAWDAVVAHARERLAELLLALVNRPELSPRVLAEAIRLRDEPGALGELPLLTDLAGKAWNARELLAFDGHVGTVSAPSLYAPGMGGAFFALGDRPVLVAVCPRATDLSDKARAWWEGQKRRRSALANVRPPHFPDDVPQRRFEADGIVGAVCLQGGRGTGVETELRAGTARVETTRLPSPAVPLRAILSSPRFSTDEAFTAVVRDPAFDEAVALLQEEALRFCAEQADGLAVLSARLEALAADSRSEVAEAVGRRPDDPVFRAAIFHRGDGARLGLAEVIQSGGWRAVAAMPEGCPAELAAGVLVLADFDRWLPLLPARDARESLAAEVRGAVRRALPPREARLPVRPVHWTAVDLGDVPGVGPLRGEVGWTEREGPSFVELLRCGIPVCDLALDGISGLRGVLEAPRLATNDAHDAAAEAGAVAAIVEALTPVQDDLARRIWDMHPGQFPDALVGWLVHRAPNAPKWAHARDIVRTVGGEALTLGEIRARGGKKGGPRIAVLSSEPGDVPGFDEAVVATGPRRRLLEAWSSRDLREADTDLDEARRRMDAWLDRPRLPPVHGWAERSEQVRDLDLRWCLPQDPDTIGVLAVEVAWKDRLLVRRDLGSRLGLHGTAQGAAITPTAGFTGMQNPQIVQPVLARGRELLAELVGEALDAGRGDATGWLALLFRLDQAGDRTREENAIRARLEELPLFTLRDGRAVSRKEIAGAAEPCWLPPEFPAGPTDHPWYIRAFPRVMEALGALPVSIPDGRERLRIWAEAEERKRRTTRREAVLSAPVLARRPVSAPFTGEVGATLSGEGLTITVLVDGIALAPIAVDFPSPVQAIVAGGGLAADRAWLKAAEGEALSAAIAACERAAHELAGTVLSGELPTGNPRIEWAQGYALARGGAQRLFPRLGAAPASIDELTRVWGKKLGFVGPQSRDGFVAGEPPVVADARLRRLLAGRFEMVDLSAVGTRHARRARPPVHVEHLGSWLGFGGGGVDVLKLGVRLVTLDVGGAFPVVGEVTCDTADVDPLWQALRDRGPVDAILSVLRSRLIDRMVARPQPGMRGALLALLAAGDPRPRGTPLFRSVRGTVHALEEVIAESPVRVVPADTPPAEVTPAFWLLDEVERKIVAKERNLVDGTRYLAELREGSERRRAEARPRPQPPWVGRTVQVRVGEARGLLWLAEAGAGVQIRVDGAVAMTRNFFVSGLSGWIEGPFETDARFRNATLPEEVLIAVRETARGLLESEPVERRRERLSVAVAEVGTLAELCRQAGSPWAGVVLATDTEGVPIDAAGLLEMSRVRARIDVREAPGPAGHRTVRGDARVMTALQAILRANKVVQVEAEAVTAGMEARAEGAKRRADEREERRAKARERAGARLAAWGFGPEAVAAVERRLEAWARAAPEGWRALDAIDVGGPYPELLAFVSAMEGDVTAEERVRSVEECARLLIR